MIERGLAYEIGGRVALEFDPAGVRCRMELPLRQIVDASALLPGLSDRSKSPTDPAADLRGRRVLVVEDSSLVAMELEVALAAEGIEILGPAASLEAASDLLRAGEPDAALLDIDLDGALVFLVADQLAGRGVPIAFTTGYDATTVLPARFQGSLVLPKPFRGEHAVLLLRRMLAGRQRPEG